MNKQIPLITIALLGFIGFGPLYADSDSTAAFKKSMQNVVDDYYKTHHDKEQFTAVSASILLPKDKQLDAKDIHTFVSGTVGFPPFSQAVSADNLYEIGSITKSFTALLLLQLQTEGKVSLNDTLGKWLPQYPNWKNVSLRQLLDMTSSIPNYSDDADFLKKMYANLDRVWTNKELVTYAHPEKPLKTDSKNLFEYSNSNYILAALVIEQITKDSFEHQLQTRILDKDNYLKNTYYPVGPQAAAIEKAISGRQLHGYYYDKKTQKNVDTFKNDLSWCGAAGALVATTEDVARWVQLLYHGIYIEPTHRERALSELEAIVSMKTGKRIPMVTADDPAGFGLGVGYFYDKNSQQRFWVYKGSTLGFRVMYFWQPCNDITTVVALNSKAGEGDPSSKMGDDIINANLKLYQEIIHLYPDLQCMTGLAP